MNNDDILRALQAFAQVQRQLTQLTNSSAFREAQEVAANFERQFNSLNRTLERLGIANVIREVEGQQRQVFRFWKESPAFNLPTLNVDWPGLAAYADIADLQAGLSYALQQTEVTSRLSQAVDATGRQIQEVGAGRGGSSVAREVVEGTLRGLGVQPAGPTLADRLAWWIQVVVLVAAVLNWLVEFHENALRDKSLAELKQLQKEQGRSVGLLFEATRSIAETLADVPRKPLVYLKVKRRSTLRVGPSAEADALGQLKVGTRVVLLGTFERWYFVQDVDSTVKGWVYRRNTAVAHHAGRERH